MNVRSDLLRIDDGTNIREVSLPAGGGFRNDGFIGGVAVLSIMRNLLILYRSLCLNFYFLLFTSAHFPFTTQLTPYTVIMITQFCHQAFIKKIPAIKNGLLF